MGGLVFGTEGQTIICRSPIGKLVLVDNYGIKPIYPEPLLPGFGVADKMLVRAIENIACSAVEIGTPFRKNGI